MSGDGLEYFLKDIGRVFVSQAPPPTPIEYERGV